MPYSTRNCMVSAEEAKKIREREMIRRLQYEMVRQAFDKTKDRINQNNESKDEDQE